MSAGGRIPFDAAYTLAAELHDELRPVVSRLKAAGSLRRFRPEVGDVEFVVEPRLLEPDDLFGQARFPDLDAIRAVATRWGLLTKNGNRYMQVRLARAPIAVELWIVLPPASWGSILAIRTGPRELGQLAVTRMLERGLRHVGGHVERQDTGEIIPTDTEDQFFAAAELPCVPPAQREKLWREADPVVAIACHGRGRGGCQPIRKSEWDAVAQLTPDERVRLAFGEDE